MIMADGSNKYGCYYRKDKVLKAVQKKIESDDYFKAKAKKMSKDIDIAKNLVEEANKSFETQVDRLLETEDKLAENAKRVTGKVKESANKLASGLANIEKQANFDRLERYVELLERAEKSMLALAELEKCGKLEKIASALK